jgi:hypothetical protein
MSPIVAPNAHDFTRPEYRSRGSNVLRTASKYVCPDWSYASDATTNPPTIATRFANTVTTGSMIADARKRGRMR